MKSGQLKPLMAINMYNLIVSEVFDGGPSAEGIPILRKWL